MAGCRVGQNPLSSHVTEDQFMYFYTGAVFTLRRRVLKVKVALQRKNRAGAKAHELVFNLRTSAPENFWVRTRKFVFAIAFHCFTGDDESFLTF